MNLKHDDTIHNWPIRRDGVIAPRGISTGLPSWATGLAGFFFGIPFVWIGAYAIMIGIHNADIDPSTVAVPYTLVILIGGIFAFVGMVIWSKTLLQWLKKRGREAMIEAHQNAAISDYPWDIRGYTPSRWGPAWYGINMTIFLIAFSAAFGYIILKMPQIPWWGKLIWGGIMFFTLLVSYNTGVKVARAIKFSSSRIVFDKFPYQLDKTVTIKWVPPTALTQANSGSFTLRCVEEFYETTGSGDSRSTSLVHNELWSDTWLLDRVQSFHPGEDISIRYEPPQGLPSTALSGERIIFWEFEIKLKMPGPDFEAAYLVPIYEN